MTETPRIAYYAPLKPPDHPIPSGDRQMARMLMAALRRAGYDALLASRYISYSKRHGAEHLAERKAGALAEAERLVAMWEEQGGRPELWFCYHPYDKSPDWLGMEVCRRLAIPMVTAEPCRTGQGPHGEWLPWRAEAQAGIAMAEMNVVMTDADADYLAGFVPPGRITRMDPFIDADLLEERAPEGSAWPGAGCRLLTVGMMRPGAKLQSYGVLAEALSGLGDLEWTLAIAGGGPGEGEVRRMFAPLGEKRVAFLGERAPEEVLGLMAQADLLAWPGCREAYGMVYLEAATRGTPAAALDNMGVPLVVKDGVSGLLARPAQAAAYRDVLARLIADGALRARLAAGARDFVLNRRSGDYAARCLRAVIDPILARRERAA